MSPLLTAIKVSVVVAAYNASVTIGRTIGSVHAQTLQNWEMIVVNDASTDDTELLVRNWSDKDPRIRLINLDENSRQSVARNVGIAAARGDWIAILDADDAFVPHRLEVLVREAEAHQLDMIADNQAFFDFTAGRVSRNAMRSTPYLKDWTLVKMFRNERVGRMFKWGLLKPLIRREFLVSQDIAYARQFHMGEDCLFYAEILASGATAAICGAPMYIYTTARGELSGRRSGVSSSKYKIEDHLATFEYLRAKYSGILGEDVLSAISQVERSARAAEAANRFKGYLQRGQAGRAVHELVRFPEIISQLAITIWKRLRYRLAYSLLPNRIGSRYAVPLI